MDIRQFSYPVDLSTDEAGRVLARVPDMIGCVTDGVDETEALAEAQDALEAALGARIHMKEDIPTPSPVNGRPTVAVGAVLAAKAALYQAMRDTKRTNVSMAAALGCDESDVRRMLDPKHATKIGRLEEALAVLGRRMIISVEAA